MAVALTRAPTRRKPIWLLAGVFALSLLLFIVQRCNRQESSPRRLSNRAVEPSLGAIIRRSDSDVTGESEAASSDGGSIKDPDSDEEDYNEPNAWTSCDFDAISRGEYSQSEACEKAYMNGLHLDCMFRQPSYAPSKYTDHADLLRYGWVENIKSPATSTLFHMSESFQGLHVSEDSSSWAELNIEHTKTVDAGTGSPDGKSYTATQAQYRNYYNTQQGALVATYNYGPDYMISQGLTSTAPPLKQWSDVAFLLVEQFCSTQAGTSMRSLEHVFRNDITNKQTLMILKAVSQTGTLGKDMAWPGLVLNIDDPRAKAVLGTPNGNGVAWLLGQHKQQLGVKYVDQINVFDCHGDGEAWCMYFHIAELDAQ